MKHFFILITFFGSLLSFGQANVDYNLIDKRMAAIPSNLTNSTDDIASYINASFKTENDKIRAAFYWTVSNISYDIKNSKGANSMENSPEKILKILKSRKGVCIDYAEVFNAISQKIGIESYVIDGYTKQNGKIDILAHAWCAAKIDGKWYFFDPTWGSGGTNNGQFIKKINNYYFKADFSKIIFSHIPFDYLWQFSNYPITNSEFYQGKTQLDKTKKYFDFEKEIARQNSLSEIDQLFESADRIEKNGLKNGMIVAKLESVKSHYTYIRQSGNIEKLNAVVLEMNEAVALLNDFIFYRNNKFKPTFPDDQISNMIQKPREKLVKCQSDIYNIGSIGNENASNLKSIKKSIETNLALVEEHASFVKTYLSKSKLVRKTMFSKITWGGIPLN